MGTNDSYFAGYIDRSGFPIQIKSTTSSAVSTGTTQIPQDDTIPQNTEGDQYLTLAITPTDTTSRLIIEANIFVASSATNNMTVALFQDSTANALAAAAATIDNANGTIMIPLRHEMAAGTTSATTFKIRAGAGGAGTTTFNGKAAGRLYGGITLSSIKITETRA